jgi:hypothetical protein
MQRNGALPKGAATTARVFADTIDAFPEGKFRQIDVHPALRNRLVDLSDTPIVETVDRERTKHGYRNVYRVHDDARAIADRTVSERDAICPCGHSGVRNRDGQFQCTFPACEETFDRAEVGDGREVRADGGIDPTEVRRAVRSLADQRVCIKSHHVAQEMGLDDASKTTRRRIGRELKTLADKGVLAQWSSDDALGGATFRIVDAGRLDVPAVRADGGRPPLLRFTGDCECGRHVVTAVRRPKQVMCADPTARARCRGCGSTVVVRGDPPGEQRAMADGGTNDRRDTLDARASERAAAAARRVREHVREDSP